eukprot:gene5783-7280_t
MSAAVLTTTFPIIIIAVVPHQHHSITMASETQFMYFNNWEHFPAKCDCAPNVTLSAIQLRLLLLLVGLVVLLHLLLLLGLIFFLLLLVGLVVVLLLVLVVLLLLLALGVLRLFRYLVASQSTVKIVITMI